MEGSGFVQICNYGLGRLKNLQILRIMILNTALNPKDRNHKYACLARADCYRHCTTMLKRLLESSAAGPTSPSVPK
jgi:hypothetical protein